MYFIELAMLNSKLAGAENVTQSQRHLVRRTGTVTNKDLVEEAKDGDWEVQVRMAMDNPSRTPDDTFYRWRKNSLQNDFSPKTREGLQDLRSISTSHHLPSLGPQKSMTTLQAFLTEYTEEDGEPDAASSSNPTESIEKTRKKWWKPPKTCCGKNRCLFLPREAINPRSTFYQCWIYVLIAVLVYTGTVMPFRLCFIESSSDSWYLVEIVIDFVFVTDLIINFMLAYRFVVQEEYEKTIRDPKTNDLVTDFRKISWHYLTGWFIIDFIACIPLTLILDSEGGDANTNESGNRLTRVARLPRILRLLRLVIALRLIKIGRSQNVFRSVLHRYFGQRVAISVFLFVLAIFVGVHCLGCLWYYLSRLDDYDLETWVRRHLLTLEHVDDSWEPPPECQALNDLRTIEEVDNCLRPLPLRYIASVYWVVTTVTTVGYGDITPYKTAEYVMALAVMCLGVALYANILSRLTSMVSMSDSKREYRDARLMSLYIFCKSTALSGKTYGQLSHKLIQDIEDEKLGGAEVASLMNHFDVSIRRQIACSMHRGVHLTLDLFRIGPCAGRHDICLDRLITEMSAFLEPFSLRPNSPQATVPVSQQNTFSLHRRNSTTSSQELGTERNQESRGAAEEGLDRGSSTLAFEDTEQEVEREDMEEYLESAADVELAISNMNDPLDPGLLYSRGDRSSALFFVVKGKIGPVEPRQRTVKVPSSRRSSREDIKRVQSYLTGTEKAETPGQKDPPMFWFKEKSYFGDVELFVQENRYFTVRAYSEVQLFRLPEAAFLRICCRLPELLKSMREDAGRKLRYYETVMNPSDLEAIKANPRRAHMHYRLMREAAYGDLTSSPDHYSSACLKQKLRDRTIRFSQEDWGERRGVSFFPKDSSQYSAELGTRGLSPPPVVDVQEKSERGSVSEGQIHVGEITLVPREYGDGDEGQLKASDELGTSSSMKTARIRRKSILREGTSKPNQRKSSGAMGFTQLRVPLQRPRSRSHDLTGDGEEGGVGVGVEELERLNQQQRSMQEQLDFQSAILEDISVKLRAILAAEPR